MARILRDNLSYCSEQKECLDCYSAGIPSIATELQRRRELEVPCCRAHFNAYKSKRSQANTKKYARRSAAKRKAGLCVSPGCDHKLIPQELLPRWWKRESTCGMHVAFKAFHVNREAIVKFIIEHCLSPGLGEGMVAQNIIYHAGEGYILFGLSKPNVYLTRGFSASDLLERYEQFHRRQSPAC
jgi:hypothetical protein